MNKPPLDHDNFAADLRAAADALLAPANGRESALLAAGVERYLATLNKALRMLEREDGARLPPSDVTRLGELGLDLLGRMMARCTPETQALRDRLSLHVLPLAVWVALQGGALRVLEPLVNVLSEVANGTRKPDRLGELADLMAFLIDAVADDIRQDADRIDPSRPWRVLNLNYGIVATRSHDPQRMERAFNALCFRLPEDAPGFFAEGMQQMDAIGYPEHVRAVMEKYHRTSAHPTLH